MLESFITLITLTAVETVLSIDNTLFINILTNNLADKKQRIKARILGIWFAFIIRIGLLVNLLWLSKFITPIISFSFFNIDLDLSSKDIILIIGGLFLVYKTIKEIIKYSNGIVDQTSKTQPIDYHNIIIQIVFIDIIFSLDSIITAVGLTNILWVIVMAMLISSIIMLIAAEKINNFVKLYPRLNTICLSFLIMVGLYLVLEGIHLELSKYCLYSALAFAAFVELVDHHINKYRKF